ncbi:hypothetical protein [Paenibacillus tyrfis]|uniref:hypothetical protein n=1 Tax=Paenibacillus tyrfis TaxID=1501230 RepID=UPI000B588746|nr:hypothetical protein [Paenibacillus tyrfis]
MPNDQGRYAKAEVVASGLPYYIPSSSRWTSRPYPYAILLSKTRCEQYNVPTEEGEQPAAFLYAANAGRGTDDLRHRYVPLYDRTRELQDRADVRLIPRELMRSTD